jgi:hypothetical protein
MLNLFHTSLDKLLYSIFEVFILLKIDVLESKPYQFRASFIVVFKEDINAILLLQGIIRNLIGTDLSEYKLLNKNRKLIK